MDSSIRDDDFRITKPDRKITSGWERSGAVGDAASGAPRGAERTASPARAVCESQIAWGMAGPLAHARTVGLLAVAGPPPRTAPRARMF